MSIEFPVTQTCQFAALKSIYQLTGKHANPLTNQAFVSGLYQF